MLALALVIAIPCWGASKTAPAARVKKLIPPAGFPQSVGVSVHGFIGGPGELEQFSDTGVKLLRIDLYWEWAESEKGKYDFSQYVDLVQRSSKHKIRILLIIMGGNKLYGGEFGEEPKTAEGRAAFARMAAELAKTMRGKPIVFELGNERDGTGGPSPADYCAWAKDTVEAMRAADPNVVIVGPAAHHYALGWIEQVFAQGFLDLVDAVTVHLYLGHSPEDGWRPPEENKGCIDRLKGLITQYGQGRDIPVCNSEVGYNRLIFGSANRSFAISTEDQARYAVRGFLLSALWDLRFHVNYCWWLDAPSIKDTTDFGMVTEAGMPMPVYYAMQAMSEQLNGGRFARRINLGVEDDYALEFSTPKGKVVACWTAGKDAVMGKILVGNAKKVRVVDMSGTKSYEMTPVNGFVNIRLIGAPVYLRL